MLITPLRLREISLLPKIPVAAAFISDSERQIDAETLLCELYGLTRAEARGTKLLTEVLKVGDITQRLEVSTATVRTHVRRVLEKTDARGKSDLIRIVMAGPGARLLRDKTGD